MFSVSAQIDIAATPERVWQALTDFANYRDWHPFEEIDGAAIVGQTVGFSHRHHPRAAPRIHSTALITRIDAPRYFALEYGVKGLAMIEEWYALEAIKSGTRLTHGSHFRGAISFLVAPFFCNRLSALMTLPLQQLERRLVPRKAKPTPNTFSRPRGRDRGRRQNKD